MPKHKVLLLGATGETGGDILNGLLEDGSFEISCLIQPSSMQKPSVLALLDRGLTLITGDLSGPIDALADAIAGHDTLISAISAPQQLAQLALVDAAAKAGIKRFVPCGFTIVCPPTGVMHLRSNKEVVYQRVLYHHLPYTIVDVGYWHQLSWFRVPSGRLDYALMMERNAVYGDGEAETLLTDKRDIGRFVTRIIKDPRTLNQKVVTYSDALSQNQIVRMIEEKTGEKLQVTHVSESQLREMLEKATASLNANPTDPVARLQRSQAEYNIAKYIRLDNTHDMARYLGYLDARELYPDLQPIAFSEFIDELLEGKGQRPYEETIYKLLQEAKKEGKM